MTSNINPNNIDTTYPIAGQDNDSQGFRDNFTNVKTNFEYAETEIDDLQAKGIFKSALTGTTLAHTVTLPATVGASGAAQSVSGIQGISSNIITFAETGTYEFEFHTDDGGTTIYLSELTRPRNRLMNPLILAGKEDVADAGAIDLTVTASHFTTVTAETATLAAGTEGQIKTLMMVADGGDMVITVANAGWKSTGSGTGAATFDNIGDACTLQYVNDKWYAVGNTGVTFSDS